MKTVVTLVIAGIALFYLGCLSAEAQIPYVQSGLVVSGGSGYMNPIIPVRFGVESLGKRLYVNAYGEYSWARKIETGDGYTIASQFEAGPRFGKVFPIAGISTINGYTSQWSKGSIHPLIGIGVDSELVRVTGRYKFAGNDKRNHGTSFGVETDWKLTPRFRFGAGFDIGHFNYTDVDEWKRWSGREYFSVKIMLRPDRTVVR